MTVGWSQVTAAASEATDRGFDEVIGHAQELAQRYGVDVYV